MKDLGHPNSNKRPLHTGNAGSPPGESKVEFLKRICITAERNRAQRNACSTSESPVNSMNRAQSLSNNSPHLSQSRGMLMNTETDNSSSILNRMNEIHEVSSKFFNTQTQTQPIRTDLQLQMAPNQDYQGPKDPRLRSSVVSSSGTSFSAEGVSPSASRSSRVDNIQSTSSYWQSAYESHPSFSAEGVSPSASRSSRVDNIQSTSSYWQSTYELHPSLANDGTVMPRNQEYDKPTDPRLRSQAVLVSPPCSFAGNSSRFVHSVFCTIRISEHESLDFPSLKELQNRIGHLATNGSVPPDSPTRKGNKSLDYGLRTLDLKGVEFMLKNFDPWACLDQISRRNRLHIILRNLWDFCFDDSDVLPVIRVSIKYLPEKILFKKDNGGNTLLNRAIQGKSKPIVKLLLDEGSPTYIRNNLGMGSVETAIVMEQFDILDLLIRHGASFHHILQEDPTDRCDWHDFQSWLLKVPEAVKVAKKHLEMLDDACRTHRSMLARTEFEDGPMISIQRGVAARLAFQTRVEFIVPANWSALEGLEFVLMVVPTYYSEDEGRYIGIPYQPFSLEPLICGQPCAPLFKKEGSIHYYATDAVLNHFCYFRENSRRLPAADGHQFTHPQVFSITLDFPRKVNFKFMACQLIVTSKVGDDMLPIGRKVNENERQKPYHASSHGYFRFYD